MNKQKRSELEKVDEYLSRALMIVSEIKEQEEESRDNVPDSMESKYEYFDENVSMLDGIELKIDEITSTLREVIER